MAVPNNIVIPSVSNLSVWGKCSESEVVERKMRILGVSPASKVPCLHKMFFLILFLRRIGYHVILTFFSGECSSISQEYPPVN